MDNNNISDHDHYKCKELFVLLSEFIDKELNHQQYKEISKHLDTCHCCNTCLLTLQKTIRLCSEIVDEPVPVHFSKKLTRFLQGIS